MRKAAPPLGIGLHVTSNLTMQAREDSFKSLRCIIQLSYLKALFASKGCGEGVSQSGGRDAVSFCVFVLSEDHLERAEDAAIAVGVVVVLEKPRAKGIEMPEDLDAHIQKAIVLSSKVLQSLRLLHGAPSSCCFSCSFSCSCSY